MDDFWNVDSDGNSFLDTFSNAVSAPDSREDKAWYQDLLTELPTDVAESFATTSGFFSMPGQLESLGFASAQDYPEEEFLKTPGAVVDETGYNPNASFASSAEAAPSKSFFESLKSGGNSIANGVERAWEKNPLELLKFGAGAIGGAYSAQEVKKAAALRAQSAIDQQNNQAALDQAKLAAYNASFSTKPRTATTRPDQLRRADGTPIFTNGRITG